MQIKIVNTSENNTPEYKSKNAAGFDIQAQIRNGNDWIVIEPYSQKKIGTGLSFEIPEGYYLQIKSRSGLAVNQNLHVGAGVIDADYRGEVHILLINQGEAAQTIRHGDRIAQGIIIPYIQAEFHTVSKLSETVRGDGGFGSTGIGGEQSKALVKDEAKPSEVDLSELEIGDIVTFRDGAMSEVLEIKINDGSPEPYKILGDDFNASFCKNGKWCWYGGEDGNDIISIHKSKV